MKLNKDQVGELWDEITPKLYGYLFNTLHDWSVADDILQTSWLKAIEALPNFKERNGGFSAWIFSIARNEMRMYWRKNNRQVEFDYNLHDISFKDEINEEMQFVEQLIKKLEKEDRELIRLRYIADLSFKDMTKILNI
ncbi:hypothetical protein COX94_02130, partial [Candidatus Nomurabacteria bacterium CG_4_10_14_0_2_um_filter_33_9]